MESGPKKRAGIWSTDCVSDPRFNMSGSALGLMDAAFKMEAAIEARAAELAVDYAKLLHIEIKKTFTADADPGAADAVSPTVSVHESASDELRAERDRLRAGLEYLARYAYSLGSATQRFAAAALSGRLWAVFIVESGLFIRHDDRTPALFAEEDARQIATNWMRMDSPLLTYRAVPWDEHAKRLAAGAPR